MKLLDDKELQEAKYNLNEAKASLACENMYLTLEEEALFKDFEDQRLSHEERRRRIVDHCRASRNGKALAAE